MTSSKTGRTWRPLVLVAALLVGILAPTGAGEIHVERAERDDVPRRDIVFVARTQDAAVTAVDARTLKPLGDLYVLPDDDTPEPFGPVAGATKPVAAGDVAGNLAAVAVSPDGRVLYASRGDRADVAAFDLATGELLWSVPVSGDRSGDLAVSHDGSRLFVSAETADRVEIIDVDGRQVIGSFPTGPSPRHLALSPDGQRVFSGSVGSGAPGEVDAARGAYRLTAAGTSDGQVQQTYEFDRAVRPFAVAPQGKRAYVQLAGLHGFVEVDLETGEVRRTAELPAGPDSGGSGGEDGGVAQHGIALSADGRFVCAAGTSGGYAAIVDRDTLETAAVVSVGDAPEAAVTSPDGRHCLLASPGAGSLSAISYRTRKEVARLPVPGGPEDMAAARIPTDVLDDPRSPFGQPPLPPGPEFDGKPAEYASSFAAKELCTRVFVAKGDPEPLLEDFRFASALAPGFSIDTAKIDIDREAKKVTVDHPGQPARSAVFAKSQGCVILPAWSGRLFFTPERVWWKGPDASQPWPLGERLWQGRSSINRVLLDAAMEAYIQRDATRALVVVHKGELVGERYRDGFGPFTPQRGWSSSKSLTSTLIGMLVDRGLLDLDAPADIPGWEQDERRDITLRNLMNMAGGLKQNQFEGSERTLETFTPESEHAFVYFDAFDTYADAADLPLEVEPGTRFQYRNGNVLNAARIWRRTVLDHGSDPLVWPQRYLLERLGMRSTTLETDAYGQFIASGTMFTTARDLARLGLLYEQDGMFAGRRIISEDWVNFVRSGSPSADHYSGFWWINAGGEAFPSVPEDAFYAAGAFGQLSLVVPSHDLVIARMGFTKPTGDDTFDLFAKAVIEAVEQGES